MATPKADINTFLKHDPRYSVLICLKCRHAVTKSALDSHLLRHKIYRGNRRRLIASVSHLGILEPEEVPIPHPTSPALDYLPKFPGLRCRSPQCGHLAVSSKRMKLHWRNAHEHHVFDTELEGESNNVVLQTFFRGNKIRYFEVESTEQLPGRAPQPTITANDGNSGLLDYQSETTSTPVSSSIGSTQQTKESSHPDLKLLGYFHHFLRSTSLTLPFKGDSALENIYWQETAVCNALKNQWLMCGLLAISASHMAFLADDTEAKQLHRESAIAYASEFESKIDTAHIDPNIVEQASRIRWMLHCTRLALLGSEYDIGTTSDQLRWMLASLCGCMSLANIRPELPSIPGNEMVGMSVEIFNPFAALQSRLRALPSRMSTLLGRPDSVADVLSVIESISLLEDTCKTLSVDDGLEKWWHAAADWLDRIPARFKELIDHLNPAAITTMAHWAAGYILQIERQGCWFWHGVVKILLGKIAELFAADRCPLLTLILELNDGSHESTEMT